MKKLFYILPLLVAAAVESHGQGYVVFASVSQDLSIEKRIADAETGLYLDSTYVAQLYAGVNGALEGALTAVDSPVFFIDSPPESLGEFLGSAVQIAGVPTSSTATLQVRVWAAAYANWDLAYAAALGNSNIHVGKSSLFNVVTGGVGTETEIAYTMPIFTIASVPEPGVMALGFLGVGLAFLRRATRPR